MAFLAPLLPYLAAAGSVVSAVGAVSQGNAADAAGRYNAQLAQQNAVLSRKQAREEERRFRVDTSKRIGAMRAAYGATGVTMDGSPMDVLESSLYTSELDALTIREGGRASAAAYESEATLARLQGRSARRAGYISAASELLRGGVSAYKLKQAE